MVGLMNGYSPGNTVLCAIKHRLFNMWRIRNEKQTIFFRTISRAKKDFQNNSFYDLSLFPYESLRQEIINYIYFREGYEIEYATNGKSK